MDLLDRTVFRKFKKGSAIKFYDSYCNLTVVNYEQLWNEMQNIACVLGEQQIEGQLIGVQLVHCPALIAVIGGIIISGNSFNCIGHQTEYSSIKFCKECTAVFLPDRGSFDHCDGLHPLIGLRVFTMHIVLALATSNHDSNHEVAFCVRTSGSTGVPKTILVLKSCVMPNIRSLGKCFEISERDVIFVSSPPTFDPFVIDILLGLRVGATLLLVDNCIRLSANRLVNVLFPGVTFMQITPSMFTRWSHRDMVETILAPHSTLRVLVLGGEKFPLFPIPFDCRTDVYNIYGITEVSCWSMMQKVTRENRTDVPLGSPLDQSIVLQLRCTENHSQLAKKNNEGSTIGQLYIGSSDRKCVIVGDAIEEVPKSGKPLFRPTGDVVELTKENKYFYRGRIERTIKRFGCRVSLQELEDSLHALAAVERCASCVIGADVRLVMFYKPSSEHHLTEGDVWKHLRTKLSSQKLPDEVYRTEYIPLSAHGKIDNDGLQKLYEQFKRRRINGNNTAAEFFRAELVALGILHRNEPGITESKRHKLGSFMDLGGTSIAALRLQATMEELFDVQLQDLLTHLLDPKVSLDNVLVYLELETKSNSNAGAKPSVFELIGDGILTIDFRHDMGRCIDTRPTMVFCHNLGHIVSVGSHSGMLLTVVVETNVILSRISLPDRIECSVGFLKLDDKTIHGVVGCYDGYLYCFNPIDGNIIWKYDAGGMIKCCPLVLPESNVVIFGSYGSAHNLHCLLGTHEGAVRWTLKIGTKPIFTQPIALRSDVTGLIFVATLDGTIATVNEATGCVVWSRTMSSQVPIFSTPIYLAEYDRVIVCTVDGTLSVYEIVEGRETSTVHLPGNVFSSFELLTHASDKISLLVGCYDRHVHCVEYLPRQSDTVILKWKVQMQSQIYATPLVVGRYMLVCTTVGYINLVDLEIADDKGQKIVATYRMDGELFAAPVACGSVVFVGCRDNFLYKILVNV